MNNYEAELPGIKISKDQLRIILARYSFASKFVSGKNIIEVGCGPGLGLGCFAKTAKKVVAIDYSGENLEYAREYYKEKDYNKKIEIINLDVLKISSLKNHYFDIVVAMASAYAFDFGKFLDECKVVLKKEGMLIFDIPNKNIMGFKKSELSKNYYSVPDLFELLNKHGFDVEVFGAFPILGGIGSKYRENLKANLSRNISKIIMLLPKGKTIKIFLDKFVLRKTTLNKTIEDKDMEMIKDIKFTPLKNIINSYYRILYVIAKKR